MNPSPVYHLDNERDRLRLYVALMTPARRAEYAERIKKRFGEPAAQQLKAGLVEAAG